MNSYFLGYEPLPGRFSQPVYRIHRVGPPGHAVPYALYNLEPRGRLFIEPGEPVYEGMVVGEHNRERDINVNPTKEKKLTNMRASGVMRT
jgi:GTP-binding protein